MEKKFVRVPHIWFDISGDESFISLLGDKRFTMWFYLNKISVEMNMSSLIPVQIKQICTYFTDVNGYSKPSIVRRMLIEMNTLGLIDCNDINIKSKPSDLLYINVRTELHSKAIELKGYSAISVELFDDKIRKIDTKGFLIYCLLYKMHRTENGNQDTGNVGYAECDKEYISKVTGVKNMKTITEYLVIIDKGKNLVKMLGQNNYTKKDMFGNEVTVYTPNRYYVRAKVERDNKYYIKNSS